MGRIWGRIPAGVLGRPYFEALLKAAGKGFVALRTLGSDCLTGAHVLYATLHAQCVL